ncbi:uncharacterized protein METZ01_LOCUS447231, partial [marine metagenome]
TYAVGEAKEFMSKAGVSVRPVTPVGWEEL